MKTNSIVISLCLSLCLSVLFPVMTLADIYTDPVTGIEYTYKEGKDGAWVSRVPTTLEDFVLTEKFKVNNSIYEVHRIADSAFEGCTLLTKIVIPKFITNIGVYAFSGCTSLSEIIIEKTTSDFAEKYGWLFIWGKYVFSGCPISTIVCYNDEYIVTFHENAFSWESDSNRDFIYDSATVYIPKGTKSNYEQSCWYLFRNIVEMDSEVTPVQIADAIGIHETTDCAAIYTPAGRQINTMKKGVNILCTSDGKKIKRIMK